jgi:benzoyl-CoA 2,3-dioxygenase component A
MTGLVRQHLIDPEVCIRCNTCEETCPHGAITHDRRNYAVKFDVCDGCGACLPPCPTGAIDSYVQTLEPYPIAQQLTWDELPASDSPSATPPASLPPDVERIIAESERSAAAPPPWSAAHPYVALYTRERPVTATVSGNLLLTHAPDNEIHHLVLELNNNAFPLLEGQSVGVLPPGTDQEGRPHHLRLYSVASPRDGERPRRNNFALTVKRVLKNHQGQPVRGVASNYLCDLKKGDEVKLTGPYGESFLMPNHPGSKLMMICTGTGSAPFRAMTERRRRRIGLNEGGELLLFFGARRPEELPYFGPLLKLPKELIQVELAFSRVEGRPREYVQDRMRSRAEAVRRFLEDDQAYLYLCGHKMMEAGVREALDEICRWSGLDWPSLEQKMRAGGRFHVETY